MNNLVKIIILIIVTTDRKYTDKPFSHIIYIQVMNVFAMN